MTAEHDVIFLGEARSHLGSIYDYIADTAGAAAADRFVQGIVDFCNGLRTFPLRGEARDDIRPGLRVLGYRRRVTIAFTVLPGTVAIVGVYYGGQDYEARLSSSGMSD